MQGKRGFTLIEMLVVAGILAMVLGGAMVALALRPAALRASLDAYDATLAAVLPIAAGSGNGATLVFAPRTNAAGGHEPGFRLSVYRGRPTAPGAVQPTRVQEVLSDADVREAGVGAPPFAIFIDPDGHASAQAAYPHLDAHGVPTFAVIAREPPCMRAIRLTFTSPTGSATRAIPCWETLAQLVHTTPVPIGTPTPLLPRLTPDAMIFAYPQAPLSHFVATEFGYTRWFAVTSGFACSDGPGAPIAAFPRSNPAPPYWSPQGAPPANASPPPPNTSDVPSGNVPYAYPYSSVSLNDAPAWLYLAPVAAGTCTANLQDAFAQPVDESVDVMGALAASPNPLVFFNAQSPPQTVQFSKTFDAQILAVAFDGACNGLVGFTAAGTVTPPSASAQPATLAMQFTPRTTGICTTHVSTSDLLDAQRHPLTEPPLAFKIAVAGGLAWAQVQRDGTLLPISTLTLTANAPVTITPMKPQYPQALPVTIATNGCGSALSGIPAATTLHASSGANTAIAPFPVSASASVPQGCSLTASATSGGEHESATLTVQATQPFALTDCYETGPGGCAILPPGETWQQVLGAEVTAALLAANASGIFVGSSSPCNTTSPWTGNEFPNVVTTCAQVVLGGSSDTTTPNPPCPGGTWCTYPGRLGTTQVPCATGSLCLGVSNLTFTVSGCLMGCIGPGGSGPTCHTFHNGSEPTGQVCFHFGFVINVLTLGTYLQQGMQLTPGGGGGSPKATFHDPYESSPGDAINTWCPTNQGPTTAQIGANPGWGLPPAASFYTPTQGCFDNTSFNVLPSSNDTYVQYPGGNTAPTANSAGVPKGTGTGVAIPWITPAPSPTPMPTATPVPTPTPFVCVPPKTWHQKTVKGHLVWVCY